MKLYRHTDWLSTILSTPAFLAGPFYFFRRVGIGYDTSEVDEAACIQGANYIKDVMKNTGPLVLNIEAFKPTAGHREKFETNIRKAIDIYRDILPNRIGLYRFLPERSYWIPVRRHHQPTKQKFHDRYVAWQTRNASFDVKRDNDLVGVYGGAGIASLVDFVCPSLYQFYPYSQRSEDEHFTYLESNLKEARKYGKPIIAMLWSQIHDSNAVHGLEYVGDDAVRSTLDLCNYHNCEGVMFLDWQVNVPDSFYDVLMEFFQ